MRRASGTALLLATGVALLAGPAAVGQQAGSAPRPAQTSAAVRQGQVVQRPPVTATFRPDEVEVLQPAPPPAPPPARFTLQAPDRSVEAGQRFSLTIARQGHDGQAHDFALEFEPAGLVDNPPGMVTVPYNLENGRVSVATRADPPGDGPHTLRATLVPLIPGASRARNLEVSAVTVTISEPPRPTARFSLQAPGSVQAGQAFAVTVARASRDGRAHDFRLAFEPAGLVDNPPVGLRLPDNQASSTVRVATRGDPAGDGPHTLRVFLRPGSSRPDIADGIASVTVNEPPRARFTLQGPDTVEAGEAFSVTIARDRSDGRAYDFRLAFEPQGLVANAPGTVTVPDGRNGTVRLVTVPDPPGDGSHPLRVTLVAGDGGARLGVPRSVELRVTEPVPARFLLRVPGEVQAGGGIPIEIVRATSDGRDHGFSLTYSPAGLVRDAPATAVVRNGESGWRRVVETVADPAGDGPHRLTVVLQPTGAAASLATARAQVVVNEAPPLPTDAATDEATGPTPGATGTGVATGTLADAGTDAATDPGGGPTPRVSLVELARANWLLLVFVLALVGLAAPRLIRALRDALDKKAAPTPPAELRTDYEVRWGESALPYGEPELRGPALAVRFRTVAGTGAGPDPLPLGETADV